MKKINDQYCQKLLEKIKYFDDHLNGKHYQSFIKWCSFVELIFQEEGIHDFDDLSNNGIEILYQHALNLDFYVNILNNMKG